MAALMSPDRYLAFETRNNASRNPGQALVTVSRINKTCFKARKKNLAYYNKMIKYDFFSLSHLEGVLVLVVLVQLVRTASTL